MKAFRLVEWEQPPRVTEVDVPEPGPGQVRIRVAGTGLCHSDLDMPRIPGAVAEGLGWQVPFTLGHEVAGWVEELGPTVDGVAVGDAVALVSPTSCGTCARCTAGRDNLCSAGSAGRGYGRDGGLAPYVLARAPRDLVPLGALDPVTAGPLTDAGATAHHAVRRVVAHLGPGSTAVVLGAGGLGSFAIQLLRVLSPARVIAVDPSPVRRDVATDLGAHEVVDGVDEGTSAALRATAPGGADAVLDFVGTDHTISIGVRATGPGGAFALVGSAGGTLKRPWWGTLPNDGEVLTFQGSTIADVRGVIALAQAGLVRSDVELFAFADVEQAYARLAAGDLRGRAVVTP